MHGSIFDKVTLGDALSLRRRSVQTHIRDAYIQKRRASLLDIGVSDGYLLTASPWDQCRLLGSLYAKPPKQDNDPTLESLLYFYEPCLPNLF